MGPSIVLRWGLMVHSGPEPCLPHPAPPQSGAPAPATLSPQAETAT